ncbi:hypothetical protein Ddye_016449 [Dipteronia dyeriana]|uniref:Palmitoyl-protein thioesterase 1 n=1 Tax=Dipteronia dyeriana TaxID=168575 RepID=A0AAD9X0H5_9ROSI|nr:hypothetical protein Ddye_016449 [Dipteronia dyeriana]
MAFHSLPNSIFVLVFIFPVSLSIPFIVLHGIGDNCGGVQHITDNLTRFSGSTGYCVYAAVKLEMEHGIPGLSLLTNREKRNNCYYACHVGFIVIIIFCIWTDICVLCFQTRSVCDKIMKLSGEANERAEWRLQHGWSLSGLTVGAHQSRPMHVGPRPAIQCYEEHHVAHGTLGGCLTVMRGR